MPKHRMETYVKRFWERVSVRGNDECWEWQGRKDDDGYGRLLFFGKEIKSHRLSYLLANGHLDDALVIRHSCDNPSCQNPAHLIEGTQAQNVADMKERQRRFREHDEWSQGNTKLTTSEVEQIRAEYIRGVVSQRVVAERHRVSRELVSKIVCGKLWN